MQGKIFEAVKFSINHLKRFIMAENTRNRSNPHGQDWDQNRNRNNQEDEYRNRERYGSYGDYNQRQERGYSQGELGNSSDYGGTYSSDYGNQYGNYGGTNYGRREYRDSDQLQNTGSYGNQDSQRNDWERNQKYGNQHSTNWDERRNTGTGSGGGYGRYDRGEHRGGFAGSGGYSGNREHGQRQDEYRGDDRDRDWWDRTRDEVYSWFGDDDAERRRKMDSVRGPHRGKGPKDYKRSEDRIKEDVCDRLSDDDMVDASKIQIQVQGDEVVLTGSVSSREEKRRAEDVVESISGVRNVENRLRVGRSDDYTSKNYTGTTDEITGIGDESGTTNEVIRNQRNK